MRMCPVLCKRYCRPGKVASLLEMVSKARVKLHRYANNSDTDGAQSATDVSDFEGDVKRGAVAAVADTANAGAGPAEASASASGALQSAPPAPVAPVHLSKFRPASEAQLDAMVPSLQPPSVPQPLLLSALSFSRKTTQPAVPLPPLPKDNLSVLLKGKHPDSLATPMIPPTVSVKAAAPAKKAGRKVVDEAATKGRKSAAAGTASAESMTAGGKGKKSKTAAGAVVVAVPLQAALDAPVLVSKPQKPAPKKVNYAELSANIARNSGLAAGRYATALEDPDEREDTASQQEESDLSDVEYGEGVQEQYSGPRALTDSDPQTESPQQPQPQPQSKGSTRPRSGGGSGSRLRFVAEEQDEEDEEGEGEDELQREYARLREQFNAKLQQATALSQQSQLRQSGASAEGGPTPVQTGGPQGGIEGLVASGQVTQSYSEGHAKVSTQDLLRMWELEDAAEAAAAAERATAAHSNQQLSPEAHSAGTGATAGAGRGSRYDHAAAAGSDGEEEEEDGMGYGARGRAAAAATRLGEPPANSGISRPLGSAPVAVVPLPTGAPLTVDDPSLDDHFLSFMNKMASKLSTKQ
jgi:hypothetical protein